MFSKVVTLIHFTFYVISEGKHFHCGLFSLIVSYNLSFPWFIIVIWYCTTALPPHSSPSLHRLTKISALSVVAGGGQVLTVHIYPLQVLTVRMYIASPYCTYRCILQVLNVHICILQVLTVQMYNACSYHTDLHCRSILDICSIWVLSVRMYTVGSYCVQTL